MPIRIVLIDDHTVVRAGIRRLLEAEDDLEVVGEGATVSEGLTVVRRTRPEVVVLDIHVGAERGLDAIGPVHDHGARVLMLTMEEDPAYARSALQAGAEGYVVKSAVDRDLVEAVRTVADGRPYVHPTVAHALLLRAEQDAHDGLTEREVEVLRMIALGHTNQEIAKRLYLSVRTIEAHRRHILGKLRLDTRADLVAYALDRGLIGGAQRDAP